MGRKARGTLFLLTALFCLASAWAQTTSSSLHGTVRRLDGKPAAGATVRVRSQSTGVVRTATSDAAGRYQIDSLPPGLWVAAASLPDGDASDSRTFELRLQQSLTVDLTLGKGLAEKVTVRASTELVDPHRVGLELRVGDTIAGSIPLAGRVVTDLPLLDASVRQAPAAEFFGERGAVFVVNGQTGRSNSFLIDGLDNNDKTSGMSMNAAFSQLAVQEMVLNTSRYAAEFGRASGGVFNIVTRQGGNEESGEMFMQGSAASWNSSGEFVSELPNPSGAAQTGDQYQLGFRLGGPLVEDRAFYFAAYERQREDRVVPFVGVGRDGTAGGFVVGPVADDNVFLRTDFNLSPSQFLMVRLSGDARSMDDLNVGGRTTPESGFRLDEHDVQLAGSLTSVISADMIHEARLLVSSSAFDQFANSSRPGVDRPSGSFGGNNLNQQIRNEGKLQIVDNLTWRSGVHTAKFGIDFARSRTNVRTRFNPNGNFLYDTDTPYNKNSCPVSPSQVTAAIRNGTYPIIPCQPWETNKDPADIGTYPLVYQLIEGEPEAALYDNQIGVFAQDSWRVGTRLVFDYGLRYDLSTFRLPDTARVESTIPNGGAPLDKNNLAPRFGFTFTPNSDGRLVVRGGGGVFYDKIALGFPAVSSITSGTKIGILPVQGTALEVPVGPPDNPSYLALTEDVVEALGGGDYIKDFLVFPEELMLKFSTGTTLDTPYSIEGSLGAEVAVGRSGAAQLEVVRARGHNLPLMRDLNPVVAFSRCSGPDFTNPDPEYRNTCTPVHADTTTGSIAAITTDGESWYTGATLGWRWRGESGWYQASYTWSRSSDLGPDPLKGGIYLPPDSVNLSGEKGPSDADRRHRFVISGESALPWMGLRASGVIQASSAVPFNVTTGRDDNLDGITTDRPEGVSRNTGASTSLAAVNAVRDSENELRSVRGQPLLPPVTSVHGPAFFQIDLRVSKPFATREGRARGEAYLQIFNLLDRFNPGPLEGRAISPDFGEPIGQVGPARILQLGFRLGY